MISEPEIEAMKQSYAYQGHVMRLVFEIEELREALRRIRDIGDDMSAGVSRGSQGQDLAIDVNDCARIAKGALGER